MSTEYLPLCVTHNFSHQYLVSVQVFHLLSEIYVCMFLLFFVICKGHCFIISLFDISLLVYRYTKDFGILVLYPTAF